MPGLPWYIFFVLSLSDTRSALIMAHNMRKREYGHSQGACQLRDEMLAQLGVVHFAISSSITACQPQPQNVPRSKGCVRWSNLYSQPIFVHDPRRSQSLLAILMSAASNQTAGPSTDNFTAIFSAASNEYESLTGKRLDA